MQRLILCFEGNKITFDASTGDDSHAVNDEVIDQLRAFGIDPVEIQAMAHEHPEEGGARLTHTHHGHEYSHA